MAGAARENVRPSVRRAERATAFCGANRRRQRKSRWWREERERGKEEAGRKEWCGEGGPTTTANALRERERFSPQGVGEGRPRKKKRRWRRQPRRGRNNSNRERGREASFLA